MREIKFRYYDSKNKIMWKVRSVDFFNGIFVQLESSGIDFVYDCLRCGEELKCYSPFKIIELSELMQYTGLRTNGKEIYEGDILTGHTSYEKDNDEEIWTKKNPCIVTWIDREAGFYPFTLNNRWRCDVVNIEIIGNIYENPELLK